MNPYEKISIHRIIRVIDRLIETSNENKIEELIDNINKKSTLNKSQLIEVFNIFFIWIGSIRSSSIEYIDVWRLCFGSNYKYNLYYDGEFLLFNCIKPVFNLAYGITDNTNFYQIVNYQNSFYLEIEKLRKIGLTADESLVIFAKRFGIDLSNRLRLAKLKYSLISSKLDTTDIRELEDPFYSELLCGYYEKELLLRQNAACACDILRLSLLYRFGGMYVDVDTLPSFKSVYENLDTDGFSINSNYLDVIKSEVVLEEIRKLKRYIIREKHDEKVSQVLLSDPAVVDVLRKEVKRNISKFFQQEKVFVHKDILKVAGINRYYEINNNVLIAAAKSRFLSITLKECLRRYIPV